ncbi:MAG: hypothetical protein BMS9Abin23_0903 [Thermodesulfobacteriota bacterium]|nr:MAG: hypothetical protein BMS9Abin23_0903 [Thermodesulfobacteriota bacterium]
MILLYLPTVLASLGLILATSSFISGLQIIRTSNPSIDAKIHKFNGYVSISIYIILTVFGFVNSGFNPLVLLAWLSGLSVILVKLWIVKKRRRTLKKYVSWFGVTIVIIWLYLTYIHIPI